MQYLICTSKAEAMGISATTYIAFAEAMGANYKTTEHPSDSYGVINISGNVAILVIDEDKPYYDFIPQQHKSNLLTAEELELQGLVLFSNEENQTPIVYAPSIVERIDAIELGVMAIIDIL